MECARWPGPCCVGRGNWELGRLRRGLGAPPVTQGPARAVKAQAPELVWRDIVSLVNVVDSSKDFGPDTGPWRRRPDHRIPGADLTARRACFLPTGRKPSGNNFCFHVSKTTRWRERRRQMRKVPLRPPMFPPKLRNQLLHQSTRPAGRRLGKQATVPRSTLPQPPEVAKRNRRSRSPRRNAKRLH